MAQVTTFPTAFPFPFLSGTWGVSAEVSASVASCDLTAQAPSLEATTVFTAASGAASVEASSTVSLAASMTLNATSASLLAELCEALSLSIYTLLYAPTGTFSAELFTATATLIRLIEAACMFAQASPNLASLLCTSLIQPTCSANDVTALSPTIRRTATLPTTLLTANTTMLLISLSRQVKLFPSTPHSSSVCISPHLSADTLLAIMPMLYMIQAGQNTYVQTPLRYRLSSRIRKVVSLSSDLVGSLTPWD